MDPIKSSVTKTSPLIIRLSTTSPTKQDTTAIETSSEVRNLDFSPSIASMHEVKRKRNKVATSKKNVVLNTRSSKKSCNPVEKSSGSPSNQARSRRKRTKYDALELDKRDVMMDIGGDHVKQTRELKSSALPSIDKSLSKQSPNLTPCNELNKTRNKASKKEIKLSKSVFESTNSDNELKKCAISSSKKFESSKSTKVQSVSCHKTPTSHSRSGKKKRNAVAKKSCHSNPSDTLSHAKLAKLTQLASDQTSDLGSVIAEDAKDYTESKVTAIKVDSEVTRDSGMNTESPFSANNSTNLAELSNSQLKENLLSNFEPQSPLLLKVSNQPAVQIQSSLIDKNKVTLPKVKEKGHNIKSVQLKPNKEYTVKFEQIESVEMYSSPSECTFPQQVSLNKLSTLVSENDGIFSEETMGFSEVVSEQISELEQFNLSCDEIDPIEWSIAKTSSLAFDENLDATLERDIAIAEEYLCTKSSEDYKCGIVNKDSESNEVLQDEIFSHDCVPMASSTSESNITPLQNYQSFKQEETSNGEKEIDSPGSSRAVSNHPWDDQMITTNSVSELEITELEKIRESLRIQLSQGNEDSTDSSIMETVHVEAIPKLTDIKLELDENPVQCPLAATSSKETPLGSFAITGDKLDNDQKQCPFSLPSTVSSGDSLNEHSMVEERFDFGKCPFRKSASSREQKSPIAEIPDTIFEQPPIPPAEEALSPISDQCEFAEVEEDVLESPDLSPENRDALGEDADQGRSVSLTDKPPLVMQSSNLLLNYGLDNRHGGGGIETTDMDETSPPKKRLKLDYSNEESHNLQNGFQNGDERILDCDESLVQEESSANNVSEDYLNSEQNGLMEFDILDEFESDGNDEPNDGNSDSDSSTDAFDVDEIDDLLDAKLKESKTLDPNNELAHEEKQKVVLKVKGRDHFEVLPEGWIEVTHNCGMPIYLHKQTRVCSMSKPYFLGPGSTRKHKIPVSAIPCLHYLKEKEKDKLKADAEGAAEVANDKGEPTDTPADNANDTPEAVTKGKENNNENTIVNGIFPSAKLQSAKDTKESGSLDFLAVRKYCERRFDFQKITVKRFSTWSGRRKHQKKMKREQRPFLPDDTKLITCPLYGSSEKSAATGANLGKREFIMNPSGKSPVCILHEYVQHTLRLQPKYEFKELENARTPYGAVVVIEGIEYGNGYGSSKKLAKSDAARAALEILIPNMKLLPKEENREVSDVEFFDQVRVEDPRVSDLSVKAGQPYPYQILLECLKRNYGMGDTEIEFSMKNIKHQKNEFHMKVGKHLVSVVCKNKRDGKHRASQAILQKLHPHISSWGSLLRMYGKGSCKTLKEKKEEEQRITELQSKACANKPNTSILCKLKEEMMKYREKVKSKKPIGKLIPERMEFLTTSSSNLKNLEL